MTKMRDYSLPAQQVPIVEECVIDLPERQQLKDNIVAGLKDLGATLVAHYYVDPDIQDIDIHHDGSIRVLGSKGLKLFRWTTDI